MDRRRSGLTDHPGRDEPRGLFSYETVDPTSQGFGASYPDATYAKRDNALLSFPSEDLWFVFQATGDALLMVGLASLADGETRTELTFDPAVTMFDFSLTSFVSRPEAEPTGKTPCRDDLQPARAGFAAGYSACFSSALKLVAGMQKVQTGPVHHQRPRVDRQGRQGLRPRREARRRAHRRVRRAGRPPGGLTVGLGAAAPREVVVRYLS